MKAVILAAGIPKRMGMLGDLPACLLEVQGKKIIDYQIEALQECGITEIIIVTGFAGEKIRQYLGTRATYIQNEEYAHTRSAYSLWLARDFCQEEFLYLNGDLVMEKEVVQRVVESKYPNAFAFDRKYNFTSDMHKVVMIGDRIIHHNHRISSDIAHGEAVGPIKVSPAFAAEVFNQIAAGISEAEENNSEGKKRNTSYKNNSYTNTVYNVFNDVAKYLPMYGVNITGLRWCEVDTIEDLEQAKKVFGTKMPFVAIMFGNPATGKTHTSRALQEYCSQFGRTALISTAHLREEMGLVDLYSEEERKAVYGAMMERTRMVMQWKRSNVVLDGNFNKFLARKIIYEEAAKYGYQIFLVHCTVVNEEVILRRLEQRKLLENKRESVVNKENTAKMEHTSANMDLYRLIQQGMEPLEVDISHSAPINILNIDTDKKTMFLTYGADVNVSHNLSLIENGVKCGFVKGN